VTHFAQDDLYVKHLCCGQPLHTFENRTMTAKVESKVRELTDPTC